MMYSNESFGYVKALELLTFYFFNYINLMALGITDVQTNVYTLTNY